MAETERINSQLSTPSSRSRASKKNEKAVESLIKDCDALLAFYDFPGEHWKYPRATNVIESSFRNNPAIARCAQRDVSGRVMIVERRLLYE